jgi:transposase
MNKKSGTSKDAADKLVKGIRRKTRKQYSAEEKIRIVLAGLRGEESIAALCRREGISESLYYTWSKEFLEAGKQRLAGILPVRRPRPRSRSCARNRPRSRRSLPT